MWSKTNQSSSSLVHLFPSSRYSNRTDFVEALRSFRLSELACPLLVNAVRCGFGSVIPLQLLSVLTAEDLSLRVCGLPTINLEYLKVSELSMFF